MASDNLYDDSDSVPAVERTSKDEGSATGLLPKTFFPDADALKPGKTCKVRVEKVYGDQVSVSYVKSDEGEEEGDESEMMEGPEVSDMDELMS